MIGAKVILFLITMTDAKHHHSSVNKTVSESKDNFFGNVNHAIHSLMETLFDSVNLATNFSSKSNIKLLLTMHYDLSNIADKSVDGLNEIQNIIKLNNTNQTQQMIEIEAVLNELCHEKHFDVHHIITGKHTHKNRKHKSKRPKNQIHIDIASNFSDSEEFTDFVNQFLDKVSDLTMKDFKRPSKVGRRPVPLKINLRAWKPSSNIMVTSSNDTNTRRVYKGRKTSVSSFPFVVSVHIMGEFSCTGSIISRGFIITAASCLQAAYRNKYFKRKLKSIIIRMGSDFTMLEGETIPAQNLYFHPEFEPEHMKNNLVIIKLERRIKFTRQQKKIRRIVWDDSPGNLTEDIKEILILGWGAKKADQIVDTVAPLSVDVLNIYNFNRCMEAYTEDFLTKDNFCAGTENKHGGACNGDVGGPGVVGVKLMGVISFGTPECGKSPTVFTKIGYYAQWIKSIVGQDNEEDTNKSKIDQNARRKLNLQVLHLNMTSHSKNNSEEKKQFRVKDESYPEEVDALKDILLELLKTDTSIVKEVLYGDIYEDLSDIFVTKEDDQDLLFLHKRYLTYPDKHKHSKNTQITTQLTTTTTQTPMHHSVTPVYYNLSRNIRRERPITNSEEIINTYEESNDYTDNYESSSEEERGMSIETLLTTVSNKIKTTEMRAKKATTTKKYEENLPSCSWEISDIKKEVDNVFGDSIAQDSDDTSSKSLRKKRKIIRKRIYSKETESDSRESRETKSKSDELTTTTKFVPFVGTQVDLQRLNIVGGVKGNTKKMKNVHMRNDHSKKKKISPTHDTHADKHLATRPYFYKMGSNKYIKNPPKSKGWDASVELRILHG